MPTRSPLPAGPYRAQFLTEAVADLRAALRALGSELVVRCGRPEEVLADLARRSGAGAVYCHSEVRRAAAGAQLDVVIEVLGDGSVADGAAWTEPYWELQEGAAPVTTPPL